MYIYSSTLALNPLHNSLGVVGITRSFDLVTLRCYLMKVKTSIDPNNTKEVVYSIPCECGRIYIGKTKRIFKTSHNNGLAVHVAETVHKINLDEAEVVYKEE